MGIIVGVQFLFAKPSHFKGFRIRFNENRLYGDSETVAVEPVVFCPAIPFNERSVGCASFNDYHGNMNCGEIQFSPNTELNSS